MSDPYPPTSRYHGIETAITVLPNGEEVIHLRRRFVPPPERFQTLAEHTVVEKDRHDTLADQLLGDPEQSWRLCDANGVMRPEDLTETPGSQVLVTLPEGLQG